MANHVEEFWSKANALAAIQNGRRNYRHKNMELVVFELVEVREDG